MVCIVVNLEQPTIEIANDEDLNVSSLAINLDVKNVFITTILIFFCFFFVFGNLLSFQCSILVLDEITVYPWIIPPLGVEVPYVF